MKVYVNIISNTQIQEIRETVPTFDGTFTISGEQFIPGEWKHVADGFVIPDNRKKFIKDVRWIIAYLVRKFLREQALHQFAQGVKDAATQYGWTLPDVVSAVLTHASDRSEFTGDGTTRTFVYDFHVENIVNLEVSVDGVVKTPTTHYLYDLDANGIQFLVANTPVDGAEIVIERI